MNKRPIGIIDINVDGLYILNSLTKEFKNEDFIYINDIKNYPYEGREQEEIVKFVTENVEKLLEQNIKMLVVISDTIIEYCLDYLQTLNIPVINIVQSIINYVNKNYEQKNLALLAKSYILKANLYQKNFNYNHMYNIASEELPDIGLIKPNKNNSSGNLKKFKIGFRMRIKSLIILLFIKTSIAKIIANIVGNNFKEISKPSFTPIRNSS